MNKIDLWPAAAAVLVLAASARAQTVPVRGPLDVQSATLDDRCNGVHFAWDYFWVTGAGNSSQGFNPRIHQFDRDGNYLQSFPQMTASTTLGGRDMECDEPNRRLWVGADFGELAEYEFDPNAGPHGALLPMAIHNFPASLGTLQALARDPDSGHFFSARSGGPIYELKLPNLVVGTHPNPGLSIQGGGWDWAEGKVWWWSQNADPLNPTNRTKASQWDSVTHQLTGRSFYGFDVAPGVSHLAGGADIYIDTANAGALTLAGLHQSQVGASDVIVCYDLRRQYPAPLRYGVSKVSSIGCMPTMTTSDPLHAPEAGGNDYSVIVNNVPSFKNGLIFYGLSGPSNLPFMGGHMYVQPPVFRTPIQNSGGVGPNDCTGSLSLVVNDSSGVDFAPGTSVCFQGWFRDPADPFTVGLSDAIELIVGMYSAAADGGKWKIADKTGVPLITDAGVAANVTVNNDAGGSPVKVIKRDKKGNKIAEIDVPPGEARTIGVQPGESLTVQDGNTTDGLGASGTYSL